MRYVAFLRGINVSGQKLIKMTALKDFFEDMKFKNVVTYIQSGNVIFDYDAADTEQITYLIESTLINKLGYEVTTVLRSQEEIRSIIAETPFTDSAPDDKIYVTLLKDLPSTDYTNALAPFANERESIIQKNGVFYLRTPAYGNTKLSNNLIENKTKIKATTRNWATINKVSTL